MEALIERLGEREKIWYIAHTQATNNQYGICAGIYKNSGTYASKALSFCPAQLGPGYKANSQKCIAFF